MQKDNRFTLSAKEFEFYDREYSSINLQIATENLKKDRVYLTDIAPFDSVGFEVK